MYTNFWWQLRAKTFFFETDNNGEYRALVDPDNKEGIKKLDTELFKAIAEAIASILH